MLRSFHYAGHARLMRPDHGGTVRPEDIGLLQNFIRCWYVWVSGVFLKAYFQATGEATFLPRDRHHLKVMMNAYRMEKALYELGYELNNRPEWAAIPMEGIRNLLDNPE
jgi:maltose alpha-D-glucosyltransferase/alpha-amylase